MFNTLVLGVVGDAYLYLYQLGIAQSLWSNDPCVIGIINVLQAPGYVDPASITTIPVDPTSGSEYDIDLIGLSDFPAEVQFLTNFDLPSHQADSRLVQVFEVNNIDLYDGTVRRPLGGFTYGEGENNGDPPLPYVFLAQTQIEIPNRIYNYVFAHEWGHIVNMQQNTTDPTNLMFETLSGGTVITADQCATARASIFLSN